jgi:GNAT superfamily N-acetyltransferase
MRALQLRPGRREEAGLLSDLALRSKGHWGYDQAFLDACRAELTLTPEDVLAHRVTVAEREGQVVGFYALVGTPPVGILEDLFVEPDHIGTGVGRALWSHAMVTAGTLGFERITLEADPAQSHSIWPWARVDVDRSRQVPFRDASCPSSRLPSRRSREVEAGVVARAIDDRGRTVEPSTPRRGELDVLRALVVGLVLFHSAVIFGAGEFPVKAETEHRLATVFLIDLADLADQPAPRQRRLTTRQTAL